MIIVKLWGGLGNQLFQYCFGKNLSSRLKTKLKFDDKTRVISSSYTTRNIEITDLNVEIDIATENEISKLRKFNKGFLSRIERKLIQRFPGLTKSYLVEPSDLKRFDFNSLADDCYYDGYWQSEKYVSPFINFFDNFIWPENMTEGIEDDFHYIQNSNSVGIHIRRGDYVSIKKNAKRLGICSLEYYENAVKYLEEQIKDPNFFIFSDDYSWVCKEFSEYKFRIIRNNKPSKDLLLMSKCKHNVISNSTFSWWAARLNSNNDKIIITPKVWYKDQKLNFKTTDFIPSEWKVLM